MKRQADRTDQKFAAIIMASWPVCLSLSMCSSCSGTGQVRLGFVTACPRCYGTGRVVKSDVGWDEWTEIVGG